MSTQKARDNYGYVRDEHDYTVKNGKTPNYAEDEQEGEEDHWNVDDLQQNYVPWKELTRSQKIRKGLMYPVKVILVLAFLYLFICSLDFLSSAFKLVGGKKAGEVFQQSEILQNPIAGLMMGVLVTVLVQSSSTSTSIVISMVGAEILPPRTAVPIVMGANIGTSVTNTIVAMGQITNKAEFRRAFAGATVHDMFNWLSVIVLLPLEIATGYLFRISDVIVSSMHLNETLELDQDLLKVITKPFTGLIVQVSSSGIKKIAQGQTKSEDVSLLKFCCDETKPESCCDSQLVGSSSKPAKVDPSVYWGAGSYDDGQRRDVCLAVDQCVMKTYADSDPLLGNCTSNPWTEATAPVNALDCTDILGQNNASFVECCQTQWQASQYFNTTSMNATTSAMNGLCTSITSTCGVAAADVYSNCTAAWGPSAVLAAPTGETFFDCKAWTKIERDCNKQCQFLFRDATEHEGGPLTDEAVGGILLVIALIMLCVCLVCIVKLLHSLLQGSMAKVIKKFVNADFPGKCAYFTGYLAILLGAGMTILVQSSSIFTSTLTPLVGMGVITIDRMYPLTLGSNIGTTFTGILAALAQDTKEIPNALQVAFCHLFFNISGILLFYPLPFFRPAIPAAKFLGNTTAKYRWFAILYLICMFFAFPALVFGLSVIGWYVLAGVLGPVALLVVIIAIVKCVIAKCPTCLPRKFRNWKWLPRGCRSLQPYDSCMTKIFVCGREKEGSDPQRQVENGKSLSNGNGVVVTNKAFDDIKHANNESTHL